MLERRMVLVGALLVVFGGVLGFVSQHFLTTNGDLDRASEEYLERELDEAESTINALESSEEYLENRLENTKSVAARFQSYVKNLEQEVETKNELIREQEYRLAALLQELRDERPMESSGVEASAVCDATTESQFDRVQSLKFAVAEAEAHALEAESEAQLRVGQVDSDASMNSAWSRRAYQEALGDHSRALKELAEAKRLLAQAEVSLAYAKHNCER